jgi:predicted DNA-binding protein
MSAKQRAIIFDEELWDALTVMAAETGRNTSALVRAACVEYLNAYGLPVQPSQLDRNRRGEGRAKPKYTRVKDRT